MYNKKVIVINGFARGGTNILWNILQSHPNVCSPIYETGEILYPVNWSSALIKPILTSHFLIKSSILDVVGDIIDKKFYQFKLKNIEDEDNRFEYEDRPYTKEKVKNTALCLKSTNKDIELTELISNIYEECFFIGLVRNGYALCEGGVRRGRKPKKIGYIYRKYVEMMIEDSRKIKNYLILKFEDVIKEPFDVASQLFEFATLEPTSLEKIRLKAKKVLSKKGNHRTSFGKVDRKYWFNQREIKKIIVPNISDIQSDKLSPSDKKAFEKEAKPVCDYLGYS